MSTIYLVMRFEGDKARVYNDCETLEAAVSMTAAMNERTEDLRAESKVIDRHGRVSYATYAAEPVST